PTDMVSIRQGTSMLSDQLASRPCSDKRQSASTSYSSTTISLGGAACPTALAHPSDRGHLPRITQCHALRPSSEIDSVRLTTSLPSVGRVMECGGVEPRRQSKT